MHDPVSPLAVVRQQNQAGAVGVEAANRIDALGDGHKLHDGLLPVRGAPRTDVAGGLVECQISRRLHGENLAVDGDDRAHRRRLSYGGDLTVHGHPSCANQILGAPPGGHAGGGHDLLEAISHAQRCES